MVFESQVIVEVGGRRGDQRGDGVVDSGLVNQVNQVDVC